jgi:hemoglobin
MPVAILILTTRRRHAGFAQPLRAARRCLQHATVVDDLIDRVMADPRLNANPLVDEAHHKVPPAGFKYLATEMLCWAAGGPQKYTGKDMESSHRHLRITPGEWDAFMDDVAQTLDKFAVPAAERAEVVAIVESTRRSIVAV